MPREHDVPSHAQVSFGITFGPPPLLRASRVTPQPHQDDVWVDGYWYPVGSKYVWHVGYWTAPPYLGAYWTSPITTGRNMFRDIGTATTAGPTTIIIPTEASSAHGNDCH